MGVLFGIFIIIGGLLANLVVLFLGEIVDLKFLL